jgi:hypothetical protein
MTFVADDDVTKVIAAVKPPTTRVDSREATLKSIKTAKP